ncbi:hypothetical protein Pfo_003317, partial [Paulownia fortunei]
NNGCSPTRTEIKKIDDKSSRQVTFSKRRAGLFKKASEISVLCGAEAAILVLSQKENVFTFGHPSADSVVDRFTQYTQCEHDHEACNSNTMHKYLEEFKILKEMMMASFASDKRDPFWWNKDVDEMGLEELEEFMDALEELKKIVQKKVDEEVKEKYFHGGG